jgi:PIN domain nuclease of toxin-antitoxin system
MNLLLDTCSFIWLCAEPTRLSARARKMIQTAKSIGLSDISILEITTKWHAGKIRLPQPPRYWIEEQVAHYQLERLAIGAEVIYRSSELAPLHKDPFDRLLVAQAQITRRTLLTPDPFIKAYPVGTTW